MADTNIDIQANELGLDAADQTYFEQKKEDRLIAEQEEIAGSDAADLTSAEASAEDHLISQWEMLSKEKDIPPLKDVSVEPRKTSYADELRNRLIAAQRKIQAQRQRALGGGGATSEIVEDIDEELFGSTLQKGLGGGKLTIRTMAEKQVASGADLEGTSIRDMLSHALDLSAKKRRQLVEGGGPDLGLFVKGPPTKEYPRGTIKFNPAWLEKKANLIRQSAGEVAGVGSLNFMKILSMGKDFVMDGQWGQELDLIARKLWNMPIDIALSYDKFLENETLTWMKLPLFDNDVLPSYPVIDKNGNERMVGLTEKADMWLKDSGLDEKLRNLTDYMVGDNKVTEEERDIIDHWIAFVIMLGTPLTLFPAGLAVRLSSKLARRSDMLEGAFFDLLMKDSKLDLKTMRGQSIKQAFKKNILSGKIKPTMTKKGKREYSYETRGDKGLKITYTSPLKHDDVAKGIINYQYMNFVLGATSAAAVTQSFIQNTMDDWKEYSHAPLIASLVGGFKGIHGFVRGAGKIPGPGYLATDVAVLGLPTRWLANYASFGSYHAVGIMMRVLQKRGLLEGVQWQTAPLGKFFMAVSAGAPLPSAVNALRKTGMVGDSSELDKLMADFTMSPAALKKTNEMFHSLPDEEFDLYKKATEHYFQLMEKMMSRVGVEAGAKYGHYMDQVVQIGQLRMYRHQLIRDVKFGTGAFAPRSWLRALNPFSPTVGPVKKQSLLSQLDMMDKTLNDQINLLERDMIKFIKSRGEGGENTAYVDNVIRAVQKEIIATKSESIMIQQNWKTYIDGAKDEVGKYNQAVLANWARTSQENGGGFLPEFSSPTFLSPSVIRRSPEQRRKLMVNNEKNYRNEVITLQNDIHTYSTQAYKRQLARIDQEAPAPVLNMINRMSDEFISSNKAITDLIGPKSATPARERFISQVKRNYLDLKKSNGDDLFTEKHLEENWAYVWQMLEVDPKIQLKNTRGGLIKKEAFESFQARLEQAKETGDDVRYMLTEELSNFRGGNPYTVRRINDLVRGVMPFGQKNELRTAAWTDIHRPRVQDQKWAKDVDRATKMDEDMAADVAESEALMKELGYKPSYIKTQQKERKIFNKLYEKHAKFWKSAVGAKLLAKTEKQDAASILDTEDRLINIVLNPAVVKEKKHAKTRDIEIEKLKGFKGSPEKLKETAEKEAISPLIGKAVGIDNWNGLFPRTGTRRIDYPDGSYKILDNATVRKRAGELLLHSMTMKISKSVDDNEFLNNLNIARLDELIDAGIIPNDKKQGENFIQFVIAAKSKVNPPEITQAFNNLSDTLEALGKDKIDKIMNSFQLHTVGSKSDKIEKLMEVIIKNEGTAGMFLSKEDIAGKTLRGVQEAQFLRKGDPEKGIKGQRELLDDPEGISQTEQAIRHLRKTHQQTQDLVQSPIDILLDTVGKEAGMAGIVQDVKDNLMAYLVKETIVLTNYRSPMSKETIEGIGKFVPEKPWYEGFGTQSIANSKARRQWEKEQGQRSVFEMNEKDQVVGLERELNLVKMGELLVKMLPVLRKIAKKQEEWTPGSNEAAATLKMVDDLKGMFDWAIASQGKLRMGNLFGRPGDWTPSMITSRAHNFVKGVVAPGYYAIEASFRNIHSAHRDLLKEVVLNPRGVEILYKIQHRTQINRAELRDLISLMTKAVTRGDPNVKINQSLMDATYLYWTGQISPEALRRLGKRKAETYPREEEKQPIQTQPQPFVVPSGPGSGISDQQIKRLFN